MTTHAAPEGWRKWRLPLAGLTVVLMGSFALWWGIGLLNEPATCNHKPMALHDLCKHGRKQSESLIIDGARHREPGGAYHDVAGQRSYNRVAGPVWVAGGVLFVGAALVAGFAALWRRRRSRSTRISG